MKIPHEEVTMGHLELENKTKFELSDNTSVTTSAKQKVIGYMNAPSEKISSAKPL